MKILIFHKQTWLLNNNNNKNSIQQAAATLVAPVMSELSEKREDHIKSVKFPNLHHSQSDELHVRFCLEKNRNELLGKIKNDFSEEKMGEQIVVDNSLEVFSFAVIFL